MIRFALPVLAAAAVAAPGHAAEVQIQATGPVVELAVSETVDSRPDLATVYAGVSTRAPTAVGAMQQNAQKMTAVVARIKALGIAEDDIQTAGINLSPQYDYDQATQAQVFRGYVASNRLSVKLREVQHAGRVLERARAQATDYARLAGYSGVRLLEINESLSGNPRPMPVLQMAKAEAADASTPVQPGLVGTVVNLTVKYELTR